jgi:hypothetical protein
MVAGSTVEPVSIYLVSDPVIWSLFENSGSALITRWRNARKRSIYIISEHFETFSNIVSGA